MLLLLPAFLAMAVWMTANDAVPRSDASVVRAESVARWYLPSLLNRTDARGDQPTHAPPQTDTPAPTHTVTATPPPSATAPLDATWPTPTLPRPTWTPQPSPTPASPSFAPPPAVLELLHGGRQGSGVGTFCWLPPAGQGICGDMGGVFTPSEPLTTTSPFVGRLRVVPPDRVGSIDMRVYPVSRDQAISETGKQVMWPFPPEDAARYDLLPQREQDIQLAREPGLYVISLFVSWEVIGDANYGFLVEVAR